MPEKSTSRQMWQRVAPLFDVASWIPYVVPAALYSVNNNLVVHIQHYTDPATFQVRNVLWFQFGGLDGIFFLVPVM